MHFGFSYVGLIFLVMLFVPNIYWSKHLPEDYHKYSKNENKILLFLERIGQVLVTCLVLIFSDFNIRGISFWILWLVAALVLMILYTNYFHTIEDLDGITSCRTFEEVIEYQMPDFEAIDRLNTPLIFQRAI